ncbi:MAG: O-antigen ligase family protein [Chitinophagales bacterium]
MLPSGVDSHQENVLNRSTALVINVGVICLLTLPILFSGMLYAEQKANYSIAIGLFLLLALIFNKGKCLNKAWGIESTIVCAIALLYFLSAIGSDRPWWALVCALMVLGWTVLYSMGRTISEGDGPKTVFVAMIATGLWAALTVLGYGGGWCDLPLMYLEKHLVGPFHYHNTTAAYLLTVWVISVVMSVRSTSRVEKYLYTLFSFVLALASIVCISKGAWFAWLATTTLILIFTRNRISYLKVIVLSSLTAILTSLKWLPSFDQGLSHLANLSLVEGFILLTILWFIVEAKQVMGNKNNIIMAVLVLGFFVFYNYSLWNYTGLNTDKIGGGAQEELLSTVDTRHISTVTRLDFWVIAAKIIRDYPLLGAGGDSWYNIAHRYESYLFWTKGPHNYPLQIATETGIPGLCCYLALWILVFIRLIRRRKEKRENPYQFGAFMAATVFGIHTLVDMDFYYALTGATVFLLLGIAVGHNEKRISTKPTANMQKGLGYVAGFCLMLIGAMISNGVSYDTRAQYFAMHEEINKARQYHRLAIISDPINPTYYFWLARWDAWDYQKTGDEQLMISSSNYIDKGINLAPKDRCGREEAVRICMMIGLYQPAAEQAKQGIAIAPFFIWNYEKYAEASISQAVLDIEYGRFKEGQKYARQTLKAKDMFTKQSSKLNPDWRRRSHGETFEITPRMYLAFGQAYYILADYDLAIDNFNKINLNDEELAEEDKKWIRNSRDLWFEAAQLRKQGITECPVGEKDNTTLQKILNYGTGEGSVQKGAPTH